MFDIERLGPGLPQLSVCRCERVPTSVNYIYIVVMSLHLHPVAGVGISCNLIYLRGKQIQHGNTAYIII